MDIHLKHPLPPVGWPEAVPSVGGNQRNLTSRGLQKCGCGVVAALDLARYLHLYHPGCESDFFRGAYTQARMSPLFYDSCARRMSQRFLPIVPPIGTNGPALAAGFNSYCKKYVVPLKAHWGIPAERFWSAAGEMLRRVFPVIVSIGKPFPLVFSGEKLALWRNGRVACRVSAHFVTMTGLDEEWCYVASWGRQYAIRRTEFDRYRRRESSSFLCNLLEFRRAE